MTGLTATIWVQHLLGTGHVVRAAAIGRALAARGVAVTLLSGNTIPATVDVSGLRVIGLPACRAADATFRTFVDSQGKPLTEAWWESRVAATATAATEPAPDIFLTEAFPFGRKPFRRELMPVIERLPSETLIAASIRDILVKKVIPEKEDWMVATANTLFDAVLHHGDETLTPLAASLHKAAQITTPVVETGFVYDSSRLHGPESDDGHDEIIVSCGGGVAGADLVATIPEAKRLCTISRRWRVLLGRDLPADAAEKLHAAASSTLIVEAARPDFPALLTRAALSVSMAGYNTVMDVLASGVRAVLVPFGAEAETEQRQRADALKAAGRACVVAPVNLTPETLASAVDATLAAPVPVFTANLDGAGKSADTLIAHALNRRRT
ncbi:MAG: glycosyltransferase [Pseudomonadota bacterium]